MSDLKRLREMRSELAEMIEDPAGGWGAIVTDQGLDIREETADIVFEMHSGGTRFEITLREVPGV